MRKPIVNLRKRFSRTCPEHGSTMIPGELETLTFQGVTIEKITIRHCSECDFKAINAWELLDKYNAIKYPLNACCPAPTRYKQQPTKEGVTL